MPKFEIGRKNEMIELILIWTKGDELSIQRYQQELESMKYSAVESVYMGKLVVNIWQEVETNI